MKTADMARRRALIAAAFRCKRTTRCFDPKRATTSRRTVREEGRRVTFDAIVVLVQRLDLCSFTSFFTSAIRERTDAFM